MLIKFVCAVGATAAAIYLVTLAIHMLLIKPIDKKAKSGESLTPYEIYLADLLGVLSHVAVGSVIVTFASVITVVIMLAYDLIALTRL